MRSIRIVKHVWVFLSFFIAITSFLAAETEFKGRCGILHTIFCWWMKRRRGNPSVPPLASIRITSIDPAKRIQDVQSKSINQLISKNFNFKIDCLMTNNTLESENKTFAPARRVRSAIVVAANPLCIISFLPQGTNITLTTIAIHPLSLSLPRKISHRNH